MMERNSERLADAAGGEGAEDQSVADVGLLLSLPLLEDDDDEDVK